MKLDKKRMAITAVVVLALASALAVRRWGSNQTSTVREGMLAGLPADPVAVVFLDLKEFRSSAFLTQAMAWAPQLPVEEDYLQFVKATGFKYEQDLERMSVAVLRRPTGTFLYGIADGRFDRNKMESYLARYGTRATTVDKSAAPLFLMKLKNSQETSYFKFLSSGRMAWTNDPLYGDFFSAQPVAMRSGEWRERFERLAGSPLFVIVRQDSATAAAIAQQAPGGFRSPQLASLLGQLEWITIGAKPDGPVLRVVAEGECPTAATIHQLQEFLSGIFLMAQAGLSGPKNRKELDPKVREAYLNVLKSAQVDEVDRGKAKSVRLLFELTPESFDPGGTASGNATAH